MRFPSDFLQSAVVCSGTLGLFFFDIMLILPILRRPCEPPFVCTIWVINGMPDIYSYTVIRISFISTLSAHGLPLSAAPLEVILLRR